MMLTTESQILARIRSFVEENFLYMRPDYTLGVDDRMMERGVIDSMGVLELLQFIEEEFGISASDDEVTETNLGTPRSIARFIASKRSTSQAA